MSSACSKVDRASYRYRGGFLQWLISRYKAKRYLTVAGSGLVVKYNAEFQITDNALLEFGKNCTIQNYSFFQLTKPMPKVYVGDNSVIGRHSMITAKNLIRIGRNVLMGAGVQVIDHSHGIKKGMIIKDQPAEIGEVVIGDDVWIGAGAKLLMNSHVGQGAVIGANAVITNDIPPYAIVVGAPARVIKYRE
ncbi:MAG: acyltransferase [Candidatus Electrothrix communis]|nr:MAG: acyltransferase [Candidatus Electrothrix communis]